jgi:hypothetical protein
MAGARVHDLVTRMLTVAFNQPMPGLEEQSRNRLLPVRVFKSPRLFSEADLQTERLQWRITWTCKAAKRVVRDRLLSGRPIEICLGVR